MNKNITFVLELTKGCNNNCQYCYNVWKADSSYPKYELSTEEWKDLIDKIFREAKPKQLAISGGEPLLRKDILKIIQHIKQYKTKITLITNGTLLNQGLVKKLIKNGVDNFELPLLGDTAEIHDSLTRRKGSWAKVIKNAKEIKQQKGTLAIVLILVKKNIDKIKETMEMAIALEADTILANRFNIGGEGIIYKDELSPSPEELLRAFKDINSLAEEYEIAVNSGIPMPPCIIDTSEFKYINFYTCPLGKNFSYYAVDPAGNIRPCNHSAIIIDSLLKKPLSNILNNDICTGYYDGLPKKCTGCNLSNSCHGGCRAAAEVYYKDSLKQDPFVNENFKKII